MSLEHKPGDVLTGPEHAWRLERVLGQGGFGTTWLVRRESDGLQCALKSLHFHRIKEWKSWELFERETAVLRRLDHPNIPDYVDDFVLGSKDAPDGMVLVQQFVDGQPLSEVVAGKRSMDEGEVLSWLVQILEVLDYLHGLSPPVIHRDVTPKNIMVDGTGKAWLVDFGTVQAVLRTATEISSTSAGTFGYAPMEQFVGAAFPSSDLYGLGMTCLAVASGREPTDMPFRGVRVDVRGLVQFDARLALALERMTEADPERRMADARVALGQLRPLLDRHAADRGVAAAALQRVARQLSGERGATGRVAVSGDDLLPSERIREAGVRLAGLGGDALGIPQLAGRVRYASTGAVAPSGALAALQNVVLDTRDLSVMQRVKKSHHVVAFAPGGELLVAEDDDSWSGQLLHLYRRDGGKFKAVAQIEVESRDGPPVPSPDGRTLAIPTGDAVLLYDASSGKLAQRIPGRSEHVAYLADGSGLVISGGDGDSAKVLHGDGRETRLKDCAAVAVSLDGRTAARLGYRGVHVGPAEEILAGKGWGAIGRDNRTWRLPAFSPDGRWLAACNYSDDRIVVIDVPGKAVAHTFGNPGVPDQRVRSVRSVGFSADSDRLLVACDVHFNRFCDEDEDCLVSWNLSDGRFLGALLLNRSESDLVPVAASGFYGGKKGGNGQGGRGWRRPEVARKALCGTPVDELIDETSRAQLADVEARWAFVHDLKATGALDGETSVAALVDATRGVTHVLDLVVRHAREAQAATPTFGGGSESVALTADQVADAAAELRKRPAEELQVLHEQLIAEAEAGEAERARALGDKVAAAISWPTRSSAAPPVIDHGLGAANRGTDEGMSLPLKIGVAAAIAAAVIAMLYGWYT